MPKLNRRNFLQIAGAAGLAPALPALPARASAAVPAGMRASQMLWASLLSRPENAANAVRLGRTMGVSATTMQSIHARVLQTHVLAAQGASTLGHVARANAGPVEVAKAKPFRFDLKRFLDGETDAEREADVDASSSEAPEV